MNEKMRRITTGLAIALPFAFLALGIVRAYPFVDDVPLQVGWGDDWHTYKSLALSILHGGLSMPGVASTYTGLPHGFLYIYFLALIFAVAGVNSSYVYIVQALIAGLSVSLTYVAVRRHLTALGGLGFMLALLALTYVDVFRHLSFKLLSENLYFLVSPPLFVFLFRSASDCRHERRDAFVAGVMLGLVVLARPSFAGSAAGVVAVLCAAAACRRRVAPVALLAVGFALVSSGVAIRNYAATGHASFDLVTDTFDWLRPWKLPLRQAASLMTTRTLFVFGYTRSLAPAYRIRPYWMVLWALWAAYPIARLRARRPVQLWEWLSYAFVAGYIVPVLIVAGDIGSYGGRMVIVVLPLLLVSAFRLFFSVEAPAIRSSLDTSDPGYVRA